VLVLATNTSKIIALDLRTMEELFVLKNPLNHGTPTCFCVDRKAHWLLLGTSHGVLDLWDLRFKLRLKAWVYSGASPVHRLLLVPSPGRKLKQRLYIAGGSGQGEVTMWDWEKHICERVYRIGGGRETGLKSTLLTDLDEEKPGGMLGRFATALEPTANQSADRGIRALAVHSQAVDDKGDARHTFVLTAGPDWKIRYWDTYKPEASMIVSGFEPDEVKPQFAVSQPGVETTVVTELSSQPQAPAMSSRESKSSSSSKKPAPKSSRTGLISQQQQQLLKSHLDKIMDVALVEQPYGMVISADRSGVIYMFM
jgi:phosphoinositide-3-kinase regulatory subunit 4